MEIMNTSVFRIIHTRYGPEHLLLGQKLLPGGLYTLFHGGDLFIAEVPEPPLSLDVFTERGRLEILEDRQFFAIFGHFNHWVNLGCDRPAGYPDGKLGIQLPAGGAGSHNLNISGSLYLLGFFELINQVHDSVVFQIPVAIPFDIHVELIFKLINALETPITIQTGSFVIPAELSIGFNFKDLEEVEVDDNLEYKIRDIYEKNKRS